jgi:hypothetical protein
VPGQVHLAVQRHDVKIDIHGSIAIENLGSGRRFNPEGMAVPNDRDLLGSHD